MQNNLTALSHNNNNAVIAPNLIKLNAVDRQIGLQEKKQNKMVPMRHAWLKTCIWDNNTERKYSC